MSELLVQNKDVSIAQRFGYTDKQMDLIRNKICKNASDEELEHFFYKCTALKLDPLMGQIYFIKFGNNPGTIIIGIDGFRMRAQATGKLAGIKRGVIRNSEGVCTGAWAQVFRSDWKEPASEEVSLAEYMNNKPNWQKMPETMIKKVAEAAALRMAFPEAFNGLYAEEEMDRAIKEVPSEVLPKEERKPTEAQLKRLFAIMNSRQVTLDQVKAYVRDSFHKTSSKDLNLKEYDQLCNALESGDLSASAPEAVETSEGDMDPVWARYRDKGNTPQAEVPLSEDPSYEFVK